MPDWLALVRERLPRLPVDAGREAEILEELAQQLEEAYEEALAAGLSEREALDRSLAQFPDWKRLHREIRRAEKGEGTMNRRTKVYWIPWLAATVATGAWIALRMRTPLDVRAPSDLGYFRMAVSNPGLDILAFLAPLALVGALGAYAAWRMGGRFWERVLAGVFPALLLFVTSLAVYWYAESPFRGFQQLSAVRVLPSTRHVESPFRGFQQLSVVRVVPTAKHTEAPFRMFPPRSFSGFLRDTIPPAVLLLLLGTVPLLFPADRARNGRGGANDQHA